MTQVPDFSSKKLLWDIKIFQAPNEGRSPLDTTRLRPFVEGYSSLQHIQHDLSPATKSSKSTRTKIAILDDGINQTLPEWIEATKTSAGGLTGVPFVVNLEGNESPWWLSRSAHGTHLAGIIRQLDPFCELYIARVIEYINEIDLDRVTAVSEHLSHATRTLYVTNAGDIGHQMGKGAESRYCCHRF
jgi:hypothetical protein